MLNEEEKKAIKVLEQYKKECIEEYKIEIDNVEENIDQQHASYLHQQIEATYRVLNLITRLQKENDVLKNHIHYKKCKTCGKEFRTKRNDAQYCDECKKNRSKEWYNNLTENQKAKRREQAKISMRKLRERRRKK